MRHNKNRNTLASKKGGSRQVVRNLLTYLLMFDKIVTTKTRARAIISLVDRVVTYAKKNSEYNAIRKMNTLVFREEASKKVVEVLVERYKNRPSGFTTKKRAGFRKGDGSQMYEVSLIE